jgi:uncharacterized membrane protein YccC
MSGLEQQIVGALVGYAIGGLFAWFVLLPWLDRHWPIR